MENDAGTKLQRLLEVVYKYRSEQKAKVDSSGGKLKLGDLTSVNLTKVDGGVQVNVLPDEIVACFDIRVIPSEVEGFEDVLKQWMTYAGAGVKYSFEIYTFNKNTTPITDDDPHWHVFSSTLKSEGCRYETEIFSGATDSRFLRMAGYKSIGFSPMNNSPVLLHCDDEYLDEKVFLRGVQIYEKLIPNLANIPEGPKTP
uniref:Peptidase M20 dimerisation domain-containing protein n=1 Tax=Panagrolaimus sp. JU765 TaxID=591449 RepID=A0AC34Q9J4_9BILA